HSHRLSRLSSFQLMVVFLFFLSLLTVISCDNTHQSPCDSSFKLTPCSKSKCSLVYHSNHSFTCPNNDLFIYTPFVDTAELVYSDKSYKIELFSIKCNETTNKWEAEDRFVTSDPTKWISSKRNIFTEGYLDCAGDLEYSKLSCWDTRLDYHENLDDRGAVVPNYNKNSKTYSCNNKEHTLFYSPKITLHPREGFYLTESPVCNKDKILTAKFTTSEKPLNISYLGSISCKKFTCSDSNDAPYTWPFIIGMDFECNSHEDCRSPNWYNEKAPCGDEGHQLAIYRLTPKEKWIWLKDQYFQCGENGKISYVDSNKISRGLQTQFDKIVCKIPPSCVPLMSDPQSTYGCFNRSSCSPIAPSLIPFSHLSSFDGRCYQREHTLKIVTEPTSLGMTPEIDFVSCQFGKWVVTLAENSKVNQAFNVEDLIVDKRTNFVCEGRVDYSKCNDPISNCEGDKKSSVGKMCKQAKKNDNDDSLFCDEGFDLVLRAKYDNEEENIQKVDSTVICDRRSGKWISTKYPFMEEKSGRNEKGIRWKSSFVCAKKSCTAKFKSFCATDDKHKPSKQSCQNVSHPDYWLEATCEYPFQLYYSENNHRAPIRIEKLHCEDSSVSQGKLSWKFYEIDGTEPIEAAAMDTFFCQEEKPKKSRVRVNQMDDTSPQCNPSRLDTICEFEQEFCTPVEKNEVKRGEESVFIWYCVENRNLFYYETGKEEKVELKNLSCSSNEIFWKAYRKVPNDPRRPEPFTPPPHSNIVCLSNGNNTKKEGGNRKEESKRRNKKGKGDRIKKVWRWHLSVFESIALFTSLLIFVLSATLFVWARRKYYKGK
ncbi:hypothetical protein PRIPAC_92864, partial [Pristionchus pacificus]